MPLTAKNRILETSTTTGTGDITVSGAPTGHNPLSTLGVGNIFRYAIEGRNLAGTELTNEWEVGTGTVTATGFSRDSVEESSNANSLVNFSSPILYVFNHPPASDARKYKNVTVSASVTATDNNTSFRNTGAGALCIMDLPAAKDGMVFTFTVTNASFGFKLDAAASETIRVSGSVSSAGGTLQGNKIGASITIEGITGVGWVATHALGTWVEA